MKGRFALLFLVMGPWGWAQDTGTVSRFTLDDCIEYALANSVDAQNARIDQEIAAARVKETVGIGLPQITGSVVVQQSPTQPRFFGQYFPSDGSGFSFISDADAQALGINPGDVFAAQNFFQLKGYGDANVGINQLIFNGSYIVGLQASQAYKDLSFKEANQTNETIRLNVSKAFYNVLIAEERLTLVQANLKRLDTLYRNTVEMYRNGFAEKLDADRLRVSINNLKSSVLEMESFYDLSVKLLKFQMNFPYGETLELDGTLNDELVQTVEVPMEELNYALRPDYQVLQANYKLQQLNIRNKYAEALPAISAFANLGYSTQSPNFGGLFSTEADFEGVDAVGPDKWYGYSTLGLRMSWNMFTGLQRNYQIQQQKLSLRQLENGFKAMERSIELEVEQTQMNLDNALRKLDVQKENMQLATEIYEITQTKYEEGVGSNLEVIDADNSLKEAQTNYFGALYDAIVAQLELKKALGILNN